MGERIYIIDAARIPACKSSGDKIPPEEGGDGKKKYPGKYASISSIELLVTIFKGLLERNPVGKNDLADIITGCALQDSDQGINVCRIAALTAKIPIQIPAATINRLCGSSLTAVMKAAEFIIAGQNFKDEIPSLVMVGGVEHMGNHDMIEAFLPTKYFYDNFAKDNIDALSMGLTAERLAEQYDISRKDQERFAYYSHLKAINAQKEGKFKDEIIPITLPGGEVLSEDIGPRFYSSEEEAFKLFSKIRPAFKNGGTVTAATSAPYTDGASGALVASETYVKEKGLKPLAQIISWASIGVDPNIMGIGPVGATKKALNRAGLDFSNIGLIELNEAFCAQSLAVIKQMSRDFNVNEEELKKIINVNGGATALGHPLGATGAKLLSTLIFEMRKRPNIEYGLVTMCIGMGQGDAMIVKKI